MGNKPTQHTCGGPVFGRKTPGCPRCDELLAGAPARQQPWRRSEFAGGYPSSAELSDHFRPGGPHSRGACGPVCTFGDW